MPNNTVQLNTELSPEQMARTKREADYINQKHKAAGKNYGESLGKDSFLKLLVTELTHQDPTKPMNDREFIAQMAQFSSLEQMNNVNSQMEQLNRGNRTTEAYSLIGKEIESLDAESGKPVRGEVSHVIRGENELYLAVGKHRVRLNDVHA
ncbi:MAG: flagellar hook assembly protein FlgD, partial [Spirochaetota bacterium]